MYQGRIAAYIKKTAFESFIRKIVPVTRIHNLDTINNKTIRIDVWFDRTNRCAPGASGVLFHPDRRFFRLHTEPDILRIRGSESKDHGIVRIDLGRSAKASGRLAVCRYAR